MKKSALISVYDKTGVVEFVQELLKLDYQIISTGGTYKLLQEHFDTILEVSEVTQFPEMLDGRVKTLHPLIHGGILYKRENKEHQDIVQEYHMNSIDLVVNNLYPFEEMLAQNKDRDTMIENIDIGGPSMIRAAAKNHHDVLVVVDPTDYQEVLERLINDENTLEYRVKMASKAFSLTAYYDALIASYFNQDLFPHYLVRPLKLKEKMRYGENPHQLASYYEDGYLLKDNKFNLVQLHGKEISYNNMNDLTGTLKSLKEFDRPCVVGVKHTNPSGIGCADSIDEAFEKMMACDDISIFGGIIALNRPCTKGIAEKVNSMFIEILIAPEYEEGSLEILKQKKNIRVLVCNNLIEVRFNDIQMKEVVNGMLVQETDNQLVDELKVVSKVHPSQEELKQIEFGLKASKHINSNGVVLVKDEGTVGYGFGEVRRSWAVEKAIERAEDKAEGSILVSDGFFFEDTIELLHQHQIKVACSPGGSIHDKKVIELADTYGMVLVFTGTRHFKH